MIRRHSIRTIENWYQEDCYNNDFSSLWMMLWKSQRLFILNNIINTCCILLYSNPFMSDNSKLLHLGLCIHRIQLKIWFHAYLLYIAGVSSHCSYHLEFLSSYHPYSTLTSLNPCYHTLRNERNIGCDSLGSWTSYRYGCHLRYHYELKE